MIKTIAVILGFQAVWFASAFGVAKDLWILPLIVGLLYIGWMIYSFENKISMIRFMMLSATLGFVADSLLSISHFMQFNATYHPPLENIQPWWMSLLWIAFAASFVDSFAWLHKKPKLAMVLGAIFGPVAYFSGQQLGAIASISKIGLILLGIMWSLIMLIMLKLATRYSLIKN